MFRTSTTKTWDNSSDWKRPSYPLPVFYRSRLLGMAFPTEIHSTTGCLWMAWTRGFGRCFNLDVLILDGIGLWNLTKPEGSIGKRHLFQQHRSPPKWGFRSETHQFLDLSSCGNGRNGRAAIFISRGSHPAFRFSTVQHPQLNIQNCTQT